MEDVAVRRRTPWGVRDIALGIGLTVVGSVFLVIPLGIAAAVLDGGQALGDDPLATGLLLGASMGVEVLLLAVAVALTVGKYRVRPADLGWRLSWRGGVWVVVAALVGAYLVLGIYAGVVEALGLREALPREQLPDVAFRERSLAVLTGVTVIALAPIAEETFFRGFVFGGLRGRWGLALGALASGLLFSVVHFQPQVIVPFAGIGVVFALAYAYCGSIVPTVLAHLSFNAISFTLAVAGVG